MERGKKAESNLNTKNLNDMESPEERLNRQSPETPITPPEETTPVTPPEETTPVTPTPETEPLIIPPMTTEQTPPATETKKPTEKPTEQTPPAEPKKAPKKTDPAPVVATVKKDYTLLIIGAIVLVLTAVLFYLQNIRAKKDSEETIDLNHNDYNVQD